MGGRRLATAPLDTLWTAASKPLPGQNAPSSLVLVCDFTAAWPMQVWSLPEPRCPCLRKELVWNLYWSQVTVEKRPPELPGCLALEVTMVVLSWLLSLAAT